MVFDEFTRLLYNLTKCDEFIFFSINKKALQGISMVPTILHAFVVEPNEMWRIYNFSLNNLDLRGISMVYTGFTWICLDLYGFDKDCHGFASIWEGCRKQESLHAIDIPPTQIWNNLKTSSGGLVRWVGRGRGGGGGGVSWKKTTIPNAGPHQAHLHPE